MARSLVAAQSSLVYWLRDASLSAACSLSDSPCVRIGVGFVAQPVEHAVAAQRRVVGPASASRGADLPVRLCRDRRRGE